MLISGCSKNICCGCHALLNRCTGTRLDWRSIWIVVIDFLKWIGSVWLWAKTDKRSKTPSYCVKGQSHLDQLLNVDSLAELVFRNKSKMIAFDAINLELLWTISFTTWWFCVEVHSWVAVLALNVQCDACSDYSATAHYWVDVAPGDMFLTVLLC